MSIRADSKAGVAPTGASPLDLAEAAGAGDQSLGEGNGFSTAGADNPLKRNVVVSIRASLNDLCLSKNKGTWAPSQEALRSIFQQRKARRCHRHCAPTLPLVSRLLTPPTARPRSSPRSRAAPSRWAVSRVPLPTPARPWPRSAASMQVADGPLPCATVGRPQVDRAARHEDHARQVQLPRRAR
ncbi:MAG: hypothetical protein ACKVI4_17815 [Actinomycetales bacterium]